MTQTSRTDQATEYAARAAAITRLVDAAQPVDWDRPSPCEGWAARDVVSHLVETQRDFLHQQGLDLAAPAGKDSAQHWRTHSSVVAALLRDPTVGEREYDGYFGRTTIGATMAQFYGWDMLVHRWDLAKALGGDDNLSERELDEIEAALPGFGDQLYGEGICGAPVPVGEDEPRQIRVLARLGRDAR